MDGLHEAREFFAHVAGDFEVAVNRRLGPWLDAAQADARAGRLEAIRAYRFAC
jgi:hypothetical protein